MTAPRRLIERLSIEHSHRVAPPEFNLQRVLFDKQLPFGLSRSRFQTACCTRRSGKTVGELVKLLDVTRLRPGSVGLYITLSRLNAKRIAWEILKGLNTGWGLGGEPSEGELLLAMPNGARIYLTGCTDMSEVEKFRGLPLAIVVIDESQSFPSLMLQKLIDEVLTPSMMDFAGLLVLVGTPGPVPVGYFHDCVTSPEWEHFAWSVFDNPYIARKSGMTPQQLLDAELKRRGVATDDPVIQREWFGRWALDSNVLVFRYDATKNHRTLPRPTDRPLWHQHHVIGVDFGYYDADAIAVLGWSDDAPDLDLVEEVVTAKQHLTPLMDKVRELEAKYQPLAIVADFASLGMKIAGEISARTRVPVEAADKMRKNEHVELLNDAMRSGHFFAPRTSRFAQDSALVEWDRTNPEKPKFSSRFHSDICFAAGTMITTEDGDRPIETVRCGDRVWTRAGLRAVTATIVTPMAPVVSRLFGGRHLVGTPDHPVWTENRGWVPLDGVCESDVLLYACRNPRPESTSKSSGGQAWSGGAGQIAHAAVSASISRETPSTSIERNGRPFAARFLGAITSITRMVTLGTIAFRIWLASLVDNTWPSTCANCSMILRCAPGWPPRWLPPAPPLRLGIDLPKVMRGTSSMAPQHGSIEPSSGTDASCADKHSRPAVPLPTSAHRSASRNSAGILASTTSPSAAPNAMESSCATATPSQDAARVPAPPDVRPVFGITVAGEHEFFANGVLVSNCDAVLYAYVRALHWLHEPERPKPPRPHTPEWIAAEETRVAAELEVEIETELRRNRDTQTAERWENDFE